MVGAVARDHLRALRLPVADVVLARNLPRRLDRLRATGGEERLVDLARGERRQARRQFDRRGVRGRPVRVERQPRQLAGAGGRHLFAVGVAELGAEQARERVEIALALDVEHVGPLTAVEHQQTVGARLDVAVAREVQQQVLVGVAKEV